MSKKNDADKLAFQKAMQGVKPLKHSKIVTPSFVPTPNKKNTSRDEPDTTDFQFSDYEKLPGVKSDEKIYYACSGLQDKTLRKFRQGQYTIEAILDLHGKTVAEARELLIQFLTQCQLNGVRYVLMIHGKGRSLKEPILKNKLNHWLRQTEQVLAFCSALAKDGGQGALYVLLKRLRNK